MSYGWLMATISVIHVFLSHFAIGGGLYLVVVETWARRTNDTLRLEFLQRLSKFFVMATVVLGALTGVGIWFIIGLLNPAATEVLIHNFVWGWAIEWTFFVIEIAAAILYYYGWKSMSARNHLTVGWLYFAAAWLSLAVINGIIAFMLTPGSWLETGGFWDGFLNPTYLSQLVFRTGICILLAGVVATVVASRLPDSRGRTSLVRHNAVWAMVGLVIMAPSFYWYWNAIPSDIIQAAVEQMRIPMESISLSFWLAGILAGLIVVTGLVLPKQINLGVSVVIMLIALGWFGGFEWFRESIRKPFVITGYMYANGVQVDEAAQFREIGMLPSIAYHTANPGADLFRRACQSCHTMRGYNGLGPAFDGTDQEFIAGMVMGIGAIKGNMPPFPGNETDARLIAAHIYNQVDHRSLAEIYGLSGVELGNKVYEIRCGSCHEIGGFNDKMESIAGQSEEDLGFLLDIAGELGDEMPAFTGDDQEREALIAYLLSLQPQEGGAQ
jgi:mono/diheme cytochrome c family protein